MRWAGFLLPLLFAVIIHCDRSSGLSVDPGTNETVLLLFFYINNKSLSSAASSDLEQVIKEDFVISLRHIR